MHYDLNNIKVKNVISCNNDIHFEGECVNSECISYVETNYDNQCKNGNEGKNGNVSKNGNVNKNGNYYKGGKNNNIYDKDGYKSKDGYKGKDGYNGNDKKYNYDKDGKNNNIYDKDYNKGNDSNSSNLIKFVNDYEIKCIYKINMTNYYKNINIYNYKKKIII